MQEQVSLQFLHLPTAPALSTASQKVDPLPVVNLFLHSRLPAAPATTTALAYHCLKILKVCGFVGLLFQGESVVRTIFSLSPHEVPLENACAVYGPTRLAQSLTCRPQV